jgi:hypothetical protein
VLVLTDWKHVPPAPNVLGDNAVCLLRAPFSQSSLMLHFHLFLNLYFTFIFSLTSYCSPLPCIFIQVSRHSQHPTNSAPQKESVPLKVYFSDSFSIGSRLTDETQQFPLTCEPTIIGKTLDSHFFLNMETVKQPYNRHVHSAIIQEQD